MSRNSSERSILVVFGDSLPKKNKTWYRQFDKVIAPKNLQGKIQNQRIVFVDIETMVNPGSMQEANVLVNALPDLTLDDGRKISKSVNWRGYELWWLHYEDLMWKFCLPYTQYKELLLHLKDFDKIYLYQASSPSLFQYFLGAHKRRCIILKQFKLRDLLPIPFGIILQLLLSAAFLPVLKIKRPELMLWTSDKISPPYNFEFRNTSMYKELIERRIPLAIFMRSLESWPKVLKNAWKRKRAVIYSSAIIEALYLLGRPFNRFFVPMAASNEERRFWMSVAAHFLYNTRGTIWSIKTMQFLLRWLGVKAAIVPAACNRTFCEVLGCKLAGIKTVGIQHAAIPRHAFIADFMPGFDGENNISLDKYGVWSEWWREYYLKYSQAYKSSQLFVSGPCNPAEKEAVEVSRPAATGTSPLKVLFISEQLAAPSEVMPYLLKLLETKDFKLSMKFRPYRDGFENWLMENRPEILGRVKILKVSPQQAAAQSDVVVGSHSSAVLEGLLQQKPIFFFWTNKWGDYFDLKDLGAENRFFALNPEELVEYIRGSANISQDLINKLQERFFGNPHKNGGKWVVDQAMDFAKEYENSSKI